MGENRIYHVTVIDDNKDLLEILKLELQEYFSVETFEKYSDALKFLNENKTDSVVLDLHLPGRSGFDIYQDIKKIDPSVPVLFLTGDNDLMKKIKGLEIGADDFLIKPLEGRELIARILNRIQFKERQSVEKNFLRFQGLKIDLDSHEVLLGKKAIALTPKEF